MKWASPDGTSYELVTMAIVPRSRKGARQIPPPPEGRSLTVTRKGYLLGSIPATDELIAEMDAAGWRQ